MRLTRSSLRMLLAPTLVVLGGGLVLVGPAAPSYAVDGDDCASINQVETVGDNDGTEFAADGSPVVALHVQAAQQRVAELTGRVAGDGVTVAVLDSGVQPQDGLTVRRGTPAPGSTSTRDLVWHQGTLLAGVIAAAPQSTGDVALPVGIAPGATIYDQRIYDTAATTEAELSALGPDSIAAGLEAIAPLVGKRGIGIVTVGVSGPASERLEQAVDRVTRRGAIVVAASAPRPEASSGAPGATYVDGRDYADVAWPAGYATSNPLVVSVTTTAPAGDDLSTHILFSSAIDVAVPTAGVVSLGLNGRHCSLNAPSTAVAAAEVSGVLALLRTAYPRDSPEQLVARLEATASGSATVDPAIPNTREGKGVVQPLEALTRPLAAGSEGPDESAAGAATGPEAQPAVLPEPDPDVLASTRDHAVWWGLLGGGALVVLVLLRPVLSRRRPA